MEDCHYKPRAFMAYTKNSFFEYLIFLTPSILRSGRTSLKKNELLTCSVKVFFSYVFFWREKDMGFKNFLSCILVSIKFFHRAVRIQSNSFKVLESCYKSGLFVQGPITSFVLINMCNLCTKLTFWVLSNVISKSNGFHSRLQIHLSVDMSLKAEPKKSSVVKSILVEIFQEIRASLYLSLFIFIKT